MISITLSSIFPQEDASVPARVDLPVPPQINGLTWRPLESGDVAAAHNLFVACYRPDGLDSAPPKSELVEMFDFLGDKLATDSLGAFTAEGDMMAMAVVFLPPAGDEQRANLSGLVRVDYRGQGVGTFILRWMEARARQLLAEAPAGLPKIMQTGVRDHQRERIELLEAHGFTADRYFYRMERDLSQPLPERPLPSDLTLADWTQSRDEAVRLAFNDSFRDHYGFMPMDAELWQRFFTGKDSFRADLTSLAMVDEKVAGFCLSVVDPSRNEQTGRKEAVLEEIGVIRGWRRRGIASALIVEAMRRCRDARLEYAMLSVDTASPTGALRLYENLGFRAIRRGITYCKVVR